MFWFALLITVTAIPSLKAKSKCEIIREQSGTHGLIGAYVPQCTADGSFEKLQCWGSTGYCWCVDEQGIEVTGTKIRGRPDCSDQRAKSKCEILREQNSIPVSRVGAYIPQCAADGSFEKIQCWASTGYCWCVDEQGLEVTGTKIRGRPDCSDHTSQSKCEQMRLKAAQQGPMVGQFIPHCRKDGSFEPAQCWASTGYCWCVDQEGERLVGTEVQFKKPTC